MTISTYSTYIAAIRCDLSRQAKGLRNGGVTLSALLATTGKAMAIVIKAHDLNGPEYPENWRARSVLRDLNA